MQEAVADSQDDLKAITINCTREAIKRGVIVTPDVYDQYQGQDPDTGRTLETPTSFIKGMVKLWAVDLQNTPESAPDIHTLVQSVVEPNLTEELKRFL